ncbi:hypothetical protein HDV05_002478, partial [Chytridiales sp. JEL 0842]
MNRLINFRKPPTAKVTPPANFFAKTPRSPYNIQIYVLPTLHNKYIFHPRLPLSRNSFERSAVIAAYIFRKWRYTVSDSFGEVWHGWGLKSGGKGAMGWLYGLGNKLTTRRAADEYFLKSVPHHIEH